jgi:hypothetical protein
VTPPPPQDNCDGETYEGRCSGDTVIWCENNQVKTQDCGDTGKQCVYDPDTKYYGCGDVGDTDACQGETFEGRCDGNTVIWCENNEVKNLTCTTCGFDDSKGFYNCI